MVDITSVAREKMVFVNDKEIPVIEESLSTDELLERAGFAPTEYLLYTLDTKNGKEKPVMAKKTLKIENGMRMRVMLKTR
ncbi:MAG TPA: hypothetical protein VHA09_06050 [Nitrososphaera sp.]|nr:hypothetical protein [Nitrososphaera sp.]